MYSFAATSEDSNYFLVDGKTVQIRVASTLPEAGRKLAFLLKVCQPYPHTPKQMCNVYGPCKLIILCFDLTVKVSKADDPNRFSSTLLHVHIHSTNENVPRFVPSGYVIQLPENTQPGRHVITVTAVDADEVSVTAYLLLLSSWEWSDLILCKTERM